MLSGILCSFIKLLISHLLINFIKQVYCLICFITCFALPIGCYSQHDQGKIVKVLLIEKLMEVNQYDEIRVTGIRNLIWVNTIFLKRYDYRATSCF